MANNRPVVSYTTAPWFLKTGAWEQIQTILKAQFPLRNIHWKHPIQTCIVTIQELEVKLVPFESMRDEHVSQVPTTLLDKPLLNIYVVTCEPTDLETYKNTIKKQVKDWHGAVSTRKNQEWLILHLVKGDTPVPTAGLFQLKGSVLDKLKTDFNQDKRDRCIQVTWSTANDSPLAWGEFGNKVKDSVMTAFYSSVGQRKDEVRRSESQQQMPGWNFCTFFILKESLASSFTGMNLLDEAIHQFDELEEAFNNIWREKNFSWFGPLIEAGPEDDTLPLLSVVKKPYRDLILANSISVFDLRIFILGHQCELLVKMGRINDLSTSTLDFLARFGKRLRTVSDTLPPFFIESWMYSSCINTAQQYDAWFSQPDGSKSNALYASKGELYAAARYQLDKIGIQSGHLPKKSPFFPGLPTEFEATEANTKKTISNKDLLEAIDNSEAFYKLYIDITNRAISMYTKAGRRKSALTLHGSLAALDLHRAQFANALSTYTSLPAHYAPHAWTGLESYMLARALDTHAAMNQAADNEWMHIVLSYLRSFVEHQGGELLIHEDEQVEYIKRLVGELVKTAVKLDPEITLPGSPILSPHISPNAIFAEDQDGVYVDFNITNRLPCNLFIESITMSVTGRESSSYKFTSSSTNLVPSNNTIRLFCPAITVGKYLIQTSDIRIGNLVFHWDHRGAKTSASGKRCNVIIRVPHDIHALDVKADQSMRIELGRPPTILLNVATGRNAIDRLRLRLTSHNIKWKYKGAYVEGENIKVEADEDGLILRQLDEKAEYLIVLPHSDSPAMHDLKINIQVEYVLKEQPELERKLALTRVLFTTLPISVNVQDFFRGSRLISKFTVSTTSHQHIRIASAELEMPPSGIKGVTITSPSMKAKIVTVTPSQPANFLFSIDSTSGPVQESLTLVIKYRLLRSEVKQLVEKEVGAALHGEKSIVVHKSLVNHLIEALGSDASWVELYGVTGELNVPSMPTDSDFGEQLSRVKETLARHQSSNNTEGTWREIRIPVDVPQMHIVAAVRIKMLATPFGSVASAGTPFLYAGQPISAELTIETSFHWAPGANDRKQEFVMRYNIEDMVRDWLISGPKRGEFIAKDKSLFTVQVTMLALHHGELGLPKVNASANPISGGGEMSSTLVPTTEVFQVHGAEKVLILPRGGRSTFIVGMGSA